MTAIENDREGFQYLSTLPKTAIQAIYHAVTGKTENLSQSIRGNVVVTQQDICRLYEMLKDQWDIHPLLADPTTTIIISTEHDRKVQYSSWARFQALQTNSSDITSDFVLRIELVTELPNTPLPQRCIIIITIDSGLPLIAASKRGDSNSPSTAFLMFMGQDWRTVDVSIDFVDYILAKNFLGVVEEWFKSLNKIENSKLAVYFTNKSRIISVISSQSGRLGSAFFLASYFYFTEERNISIYNLLLTAALCLIIWSLVQIVSAKVFSDARRMAAESIIPSTILLTDGDKDAYSSAMKLSSTSRFMAFRIFGSALFAIILNVGASYVFSWLQ